MLTALPYFNSFENVRKDSKLLDQEIKIMLILKRQHYSKHKYQIFCHSSGSSEIK